MDGIPVHSCYSRVPTGNQRELPMWGTFMLIFLALRGYSTARWPFTGITTAQKRRNIYLSLFGVFPWMVFSNCVYLMRLDTNRCIHRDVFHWSIRCVDQHLTLRINKNVFNRKQQCISNFTKGTRLWFCLLFIIHYYIYLQTRFP